MYVVVGICECSGGLYVYVVVGICVCSGGDVCM